MENAKKESCSHSDVQATLFFVQFSQSTSALGGVEKRKRKHKECKNQEEYGTYPSENRIGNEGLDEKGGCKRDKDNIKKQREGYSASHSSDSGVVDLEDVDYSVYPQSDS